MAVKVGEIYADIKILSREKRSDNKHYKYTCQCLLCGDIFKSNAPLQQAKKGGCLKCVAKAKKNDLFYQDCKYIGYCFGHMEVKVVTDTFLKRRGAHRRVLCYCHACGRYSMVSLYDLRKKSMHKCVWCSKDALKKGREYTKEKAIDGTLITAIDGRRKTNKNSTTGHTGVSRTKAGRYRAYITFKRKMISLGVYDDVEDAVAARKQGEKEIYGTFLKSLK